MKKPCLIILLICSLFKIDALDFKGRANKLQSTFLHTACDKYGLKPYAIGAGMSDDVEILSVDFIAEGLFSLEEARRLYVSLVEDFINYINSDVILRPYLHSYPLKAKNVEMALSIRMKNSRPPAKSISLVTMAHGIVDYSYFDHERRVLKTITVEPYEEARSKVYPQLTSEVKP